MYIIRPLAFFFQDLKKLKKKYPRIKKDLEPLIEKLEQGIFEGVRLQGFIGDVYKVRVGSIDQKKGKSGGFRVLYYVVTEAKHIWLMHIYAKANQLNPTAEQIRKLNQILEDFL